MSTRASMSRSKAKSSKPVTLSSTGSVSRVSKTVASSTSARKRQASPHQQSHVSKRHKAQIVLNEAPNEPLDVFVFGNGENGELGLGAMIKKKKDPTVALFPTRIESLNTKNACVTQAAAGGMHSAVLARDGRIFTWGVNDNKALGRDTNWEEPPEGLPKGMSDLNPLESTPTLVSLDVLGPEPPCIVQVAVSASATFALTDDGRVLGWGSFRASDGLFGFIYDSIKNKTKPSESEQLQVTPAFIPGLPPIKQLSCGADHVLALTHSREVFAWGCGEQFELGRRVIERRRYESLIPHPVGLRGKEIERVYAGSNHNFAISKSGVVYAWGLNNFGQTGIPASDDKLTVPFPTEVKSLASYRIKHISGGSHHSLACTEDGQVLAWGRCDDCQMGVSLSSIPRDHLVFDSARRPRILNVPTIIPGLRATYVAAGIDNSMAITKDGKLYAWGFSSEYRTGLGTEDSVETPTLIKEGDIVGKSLVYVESHGQFSVAAGRSSAK